MLKLGVGLLLVAAVSLWAGATMQNGVRDVQTSLTQLVYPRIRDMRHSVALTPQKGTLRAPDSLAVPTIGRELGPDPDQLMTNRDVASARFVNTVAADDSSIARGQRAFTRLCVPCHGKAMAGDGPVAAKFMPPTDLLGATARGRSDGYIYSYIRYGGAVMPKYGQALSPQATWDVINYIRQQQKVSPR
jgi:mono/diheme cytochrome c family protein